MVRLISPVPEWDKTLAEFDAYLVSRERSNHTRTNYLSDLASFANWWRRIMGEPLRSLDQITSVELREWKKDLGNSTSGASPGFPHGKPLAPETINRKLAALSSFLRWAVGRGYVASAAERPRTIRHERPGPRWLKRSQQLALERGLEHNVNRRNGPRNKSLVLFALNTGLRVAELAALKWRDVTMSERKGEVVVRKGKGSKQRAVPLNPEAREALHSLGFQQNAGTDGPIFLSERGPMSARGIREVVESFAKLSGIEDLSCHVLRHTFCHNLALKNVRIEIIKTIAGHESIQTTSRYTQPSGDELQEAVNQLGEEEFEEKRPRSRSTRAKAGR